MTNSNANSLCPVDKRSVIAVSAGLLIGLGLILQWIEVLFTHFVPRNAWVFATLFGEIWNAIEVWLSLAPSHQDLRYLPLVLVVTGAAILFSRRSKRASTVSQS
ncbi:MAG TPA: hypothetical protein VGL97_23870 [Bryobacteraceae bacterium]|jgi:hypothetical protein